MNVATIVILGLLVIVLALLFATLVLIVLDGRDRRHAILVTMAEVQAANLVKVASVPQDALMEAIGALIGERRQLITAAMSANPDPLVSRRFGIIDEAQTRAERPPMDERDFFEQLRQEATSGTDHTLRDSQGNIPTPVGM